MRKVKLTKESTKDILDNLLKRSPNNYTEYADTVQEIVDNVKSNGDKALFDYTKKFDRFFFVSFVNFTIRIFFILSVCIRSYLRLI